MEYKLGFDPADIDTLARQYVTQNKDQANENRIIEEIAPRAKRNGGYNKEDFLKVCHWKTPRTQPRWVENDEPFIREITAMALKTQNEQARIEVLTLLKGVDWPTASALLHFGHPYPFPILDFRALQSLDIPQPPEYTFSFWWKYVEACRKIANRCKVPMRTLDRALWQFSKNQVAAETSYVPQLRYTE